jgi:hypothetical protein
MHISDPGTYRGTVLVMWVCRPFTRFADPGLAGLASNLKGVFWVNLCGFGHKLSATGIRTEYSILPRNRILENKLDELRLLIAAEYIFYD